MRPLLLILLLLSASLAYADTYGIPAQYMNDPAIDLMKDGRALLPEEVHQLVIKSKGRFDISTLNPDESSDLWKNVYLKELPEDTLPIRDLDEVSYHSNVLSQTGIYRFNIQKENGKLYTMMLSKGIHKVLLAKALLRKIGYVVPDIKYLPRVSIKFKNEGEKLGFISYLENVAFAGSAKSWIVDQEIDQLILQDLVVMESDNRIYNLAMNVTSDMIQGRRLISSLVVPFTIVDLLESVNLFRWSAGVVDNKNVILDYDQAKEFQCSWEDARWMSRRISKLTRADWVEIVEASQLPRPVQMILVEKIISRRNTIMKLFKIDAEDQKIDTDVSSGVELVNGKLVQERWPGYASRFAYGDPDSPLSAGEIKAWIKSKAMSLAMDYVVSQLNQRPFMGTDLKEMNNEKFQEMMKQEVADAIKENRPVTVPMKPWHFPTAKGELILNRNIITGTYLGTDNLVQLADTVGVSLSAGQFMGVAGLPDPYSAFGALNASLTRTYSHIRPVTSIQRANKYSFKNIFIPLIQLDYGEKLHNAALVTFKEGASEDEKKAKIEKVLKPFKESMDIGESIIITDTLNTSLGLEADYGTKNIFKASMNLVAGNVVVSRFHVYRKSEDEFQIYRDLGQDAMGGIGFAAKSYIPVIDSLYKKNFGHSNSKFFSLNLNPKNPDIIRNVSLLRRAIIINSTSEIEEVDELKPLVIKHAFTEGVPSLNLIFWQWKWLGSSTNMTLIHPKGDQRLFRRQYLGKSSGRNYQSYLASTIGHWLDIFLDRKATINDGTGNNPGYSFKGSGSSKVLSLDEEVDSDGRPKESFVMLNRVYNGWSIDREKAQKILDEMKARYRFEFYNAPVLNDSRRIFLYNISVNFFFYSSAINYLKALSEEEIIKIFKNNLSQKDAMLNPADVDEDESGVERFLRFLKRVKKYSSESKFEKANKYLLKAYSYAEEKLTLKGLTLLSGGDENIYFNSSVEGFREGDEAEDGKRKIPSTSLGEFGQHVLGPVYQLQRDTGMLEGEFFIYWLMTRLI
ncbi:MAG: hypothetical protein AB7I27_01575 [Bacteriovoracaceae bacterium]